MVKCNVFEMKINYNLLNKSIDYYKKDNHGNSPNYLIMNIATKDIMRADVGANSYIAESGAFYATYHGIPIAICNKMNDGEIDIV